MVERRRRDLISHSHKGKGSSCPSCTLLSDPTAPTLLPGAHQTERAIRYYVGTNQVHSAVNQLKVGHRKITGICQSSSFDSYNGAPRQYENRCKDMRHNSNHYRRTATWKCTSLFRMGTERATLCAIYNLDKHEPLETAANDHRPTTYTVPVDRRMGNNETLLVTVQAPQTLPEKVYYNGCLIHPEEYGDRKFCCFRCFKEGQRHALETRIT